MNGDDTASLIYLMIWGVVLGGYLLATSRNRMGETMRQAALWFLIFAGAVAIAGLWPTIQNTVAPRASFETGVDEITLIRNRDGHFYLTLEINDREIEFLIDTGATNLVLNMADASRAGINTRDLAFLGTSSTANGVVRTAFVELDTVRLGTFELRSFPASVNQGELFGSLLGMRFLEEFGRIEISGERMTIRR